MQAISEQSADAFKVISKILIKFTINVVSDVCLYGHTPRVAFSIRNWLH